MVDRRVFVCKSAHLSTTIPLLESETISSHKQSIVALASTNTFIRYFSSSSEQVMNWKTEY